MVKDNILKNYKKIIFFVCVVIFMSLAEDVFEREILQGDIIGYQFVSKYFIHNSITPIVKVITEFGGANCLVVLTIFLFFAIRNKKIGYLITSNLVIITLLNQLFKFILQRPRPTEFRIIDAGGYSFPSGHSMVSMAFYGFLIYLAFRYIQNKSLRNILMIGLSCLIVLIGVSRIYLGVHYTSDVLAGFVFSIAYLLVFIDFANKKVLKLDNQ